jgi:hypothetical protein
MAARQAGPVGLSTMPIAGRTSLPGLATPNNRVHGGRQPGRRTARRDRGTREVELSNLEEHV